MAHEFNWVASVYQGKKEFVKMIFKGRHKFSNDEGIKGDVMCRPAHLGDGDYTVTVAWNDCETLEGQQFTRYNFPNWEGK